MVRAGTESSAKMKVDRESFERGGNCSDVKHIHSVPIPDCKNLAYNSDKLFAYTKFDVLRIIDERRI